MSNDLSTVISMLKDISIRMSNVEKKIGISSGTTSSSSSSSTSAASTGGLVGKYDEWMESAMKPIDEAAVALRDNGFKSAKKCANFIRKAAKGVRVIVEASVACKEPSAEEFQKLMNDNVWSVAKKGKMVRTKKLGRNYEKALAETMDVFNWPAQSGEIGPAEFLSSSEGSVEYHGNRCRVEYKKTEHGAEHMKFCNGVRDLIRSLKTFVLVNGMKKQFKWSGSASLSDFAPSAAPEKKKKEDAKPAAVTKTTNETAGKGESAANEAMDMGALFAELNKGGAITKGMKHVSNDMKVYKNKKLRKTGPVKVKKKAAPKKKAAAKKKIGPPSCKFVRAQRMWYVENQPADSKTEVEFKKFTEAAYLYKCQKGSVVTLKGKGKNCQLVNCEGTTVIFENLVAGVEVTNCKNLKLICSGTCNMFRFDKTDGIKTFLTDAENIKHVTFSCTKCSELNVEFPDPKDPKNETINKPIPSLFEHKIVGDKIHSEVSHLYG